MKKTTSGELFSFKMWEIEAWTMFKCFFELINLLSALENVSKHIQHVFTNVLDYFSWNFGLFRQNLII